MKIFHVDKEIIMYAFKYALGRSTYATGTMSEFLMKNWDKFSRFEKDQIQHEIREAINEGNIGMEVDKQSWIRVLGK